MAGYEVKPFVLPHGPPQAGDPMWTVQKNTIENMTALIEWAAHEIEEIAKAANDD